MSNKILNEYYYFTYGAITPLLVSFLVIYLGKIVPNNFWIFNKSFHNVYKALLLGFIISTLSYFIINNLIKGDNAFSKSTLLGLLAAEILVFTNEDTKYSISTIVLFLFVYFFSVEQIK